MRGSGLAVPFGLDHAFGREGWAVVPERRGCKGCEDGHYGCGSGYAEHLGPVQFHDGYCVRADEGDERLGEGLERTLCGGAPEVEIEHGYYLPAVTARLAVL